MHPILIYLVLINGLTWLAYWADKRAARYSQRRVPEKTLHLLAFLGGTPAAFAAQKMLRHKTRKTSFRMMFLLVFLLQLAAIVAFLVLMPAS